MKKILALFVFTLALGIAPLWAQNVPQSQQEIALSFAPIVKQATPAVVNIYTRKVIKTRAINPLFNDPFFRQFFGDNFNFGQPSERVQNSLGSGVVLSSDGLIVTNNHVVEGADQVTVVLSDNREFEGKIVLADEKFDLALVRIDTKGEKLPILPLRDSDEVAVGDLVLAIGDPFGVGQTVTSGIVSGLARTQTGINDYGFFIQTDAAINPGNSGGALITLDGKLIGINTAIFSKSGGSIGIGFAIPSNMVKAFMAAEAHGGKLVQPWVGIAGETLTPDIAKALRLDRPGGVVIRNLYPGSPADKAGLKPGDVVLAINGKPVADPQSLRFRLATLSLNSEAELLVKRKDATQTFKVPLIAAPKDPAPDERELKGNHPLNGLVVANLSPALSEEVSASDWMGVVVTGVRPGTFSARVGFQPGDIILSLNGTKVTNSAELERASQKAASSWEIEVKRNGQVNTLKIG